MINQSINNQSVNHDIWPQFSFNLAPGLGQPFTICHVDKRFSLSDQGTIFTQNSTYYTDSLYFIIDPTLNMQTTDIY